ncbi:MAG: hypothetical protein JNM50_12010 [Chromatiales bacterium]|jgi:hypothetical protein|nr:hypothetical protein [Chromatiales bacterium]
MLTVELGTIATAVVAAVVAVVTWRQYLVDRANLKLALFEKRLAVFVATRLFLTQILRAGRTSMPEVFDYRAGIGEAEFLFEQDLVDYLREIDRRALSLWANDETLKPMPVGEDRSALVETRMADLEWLSGEIPKLKGRFHPYLGFKEWT